VLKETAMLLELAAQHLRHAVCAWSGNSQHVGAKHFLQVTDEQKG
jgi:hypothetical protein